LMFSIMPRPRRGHGHEKNHSSRGHGHVVVEAYSNDTQHRRRSNSDRKSDMGCCWTC
jgi:hypothetical protein